ncbi:TetR/AcrR family transcriptional regulator [Streptomyces sp. NBC_00893]|uniref:TetR/AcrR family transcriptional regulator n=1 Tax=Streptomyces sp. NBC_00893 TaxID=2975862 RepID=UPI0022532B2C|nr:TetR family transcriptional regulator [Streptomyces sp. NBC_00893]MCX4846063.1 TetR family transcriptional regulator C-terminal domain-containing protein [Streptomyces sp. NBC_00893]
MSNESTGPSPRTDTREKIIEAAASLIPELGWGDVSSRRVAERAGVNTGVIHYHVGSIGELRRIAAVRKIRTFFLGRIEEALSQTDPAAAVETMLRALSANDPRDPELLLLYESLVAASRDDELRAEIAALLAELRQRLCDWFADRGVARPLTVAVTLTAAIDGYLLQRSLDPSVEPGPLIDGLVGMVRQQLAADGS